MKEKILKVTAEVQEVQVEPEFHAVFKCPHCGVSQSEELFGDENKTVTVICYSKYCKKNFKVKIPKYL